MSVKENAVLLTGRDENGDKQLCYPITKLECVDGAEELAKKNDIAQADWSETDETSPAYVKNRPFYTLPDLYAERERTFTASGSAYSAPLDEGGIEPVEGETYIVVWDGVEYTCTATRAEFHPVVNPGVTLSFIKFLGNPKLFYDAGGKISGLEITYDGEGTGEPFAIQSYGAVSPATVYATTGGTHTLRVYPKNNIKKLDKKYLPEDTGGITAVSVNGTVLTVTNGAVDIPIPSVPTKVSDLQNDSDFISGEEFSGIEFSVNTMRNNLFLPMAEWDGDTTDHVNILGMFYKVSESTIVPPRVMIEISVRATDGSILGETTALSDGAITDLAEMLGITVFTVGNDPVLVVAERAGTIPAAVVEQMMGVNPGMDIPYEAGTYVFGQQNNNEFLFIKTAEGVMPIKDYIDAKIEAINISGSSNLPAVSASDNGKFLRVVDGLWSVSALTDVSQEGA